MRVTLPNLRCADRARVFGQTPGSDLLLAAQLKVKPHLLVEIALKLIAMEQHLQSPLEFAGKAHGIPTSSASPHAVWITREMAPITRSNCDISTPSCFLPSRRKRVIARAAIARGHAPLRLHPALDQHALQGRVERAFLHLQHLFRAVLDVFGDFITVQPAAHGQGFQDEQVERAGRDFVAISFRDREYGG